MIAPTSMMNNQRLYELISETSSIIEGDLGYWRVKFGDRQLLIVTSEQHNRMRVMTPVIDEELLTDDELKILLVANFDRALDARYAIAGGYLWSVFIHPFHDLSEELFIDAMNQVVELANNYGGSYSSSPLVFGDEDEVGN